MTRAWVRVNYPGKKTLSRSEAMEHLRSGPAIAWFKPWLQETTLRFPGMTKRGGYGYAHFSGGSEGPFQIDVRTFWDREDLQWGLDTLHGINTRCDDRCDGLFYWTPTTVATGPEVKL
jgi:hypothetical protein